MLATQKNVALTNFKLQKKEKEKEATKAISSARRM
jgi:hypothetical protein